LFNSSKIALKDLSPSCTTATSIYGNFSKKLESVTGGSGPPTIIKQLGFFALSSLPKT